MRSAGCAARARLPLIDAYREVLGGPRVGFFEDWLTHPDAADPYWRGLRAPAAAGLAVPVSLVGGWHDVNPDQTLDQYARLRARASRSRPRRRWSPARPRSRTARPAC